jgi:hypothetical protein
LATGILHTFLAWSKNTADETEVRGTVEAPARVEKLKFNCFYKQDEKDYLVFPVAYSKDASRCGREKTD